MFDLIGESPLRFLLALVIGFATAWWIWARREVAVDETEVRREPEAAPQPARLAEPEPEPLAEPVAPLAVAPLAAVAAPLAAAGDIAPRIAPAVGADDDLLKINGIGPKLNDLCHELGVRRFDQIAAWTAADIAEVDARLGTFRGRIERDEWVEQARLLAAGEDAEWESRFGTKG